MDLMLKGKAAIVGGRQQGLGRACAGARRRRGERRDLQPFANRNRKSRAGNPQPTGVDVLAFAGDLDHHDTIRGLVAAAADRFGRLDILVNNSGGPPLADAHDATEEQWATAVQRSLLLRAHVPRSPAASEAKRRRPHHQHPREHGLPADPEARPFRCDAHGRGRVREEPRR